MSRAGGRPGGIPPGLSTMAIVAKTQGRWNEAARLEATKDNLALMYWYQGRIDEAILLLEMVPEARRIVSGEQAPETPIVMETLGDMKDSLLEGLELSTKIPASLKTKMNRNMMKSTSFEKGILYTIIYN